MKNVLVLGTGNFGSLVFERVSPYSDATIMSVRSSSDDELAAAVGRADVLILAIPFEGYESAIARIKPSLRESTLIIDVCSVKVKPVAKLHELLPDHSSWLMSHPLFGPQSAKDGTKGLDFIVCESSPAAEGVIKFCKTELELNVITMSAEEHDKQMAKAQALTFFISEALQGVEVGEQELMTPSYKKLVSLAELAAVESRELLTLFQDDNPYADDVREQFLKAAETLDENYR